MGTFGPVEDDGVVGRLLGMEDAIGDGRDYCLLVEREAIELMLVASHGLLVAACSGRLIDLQTVAVFIDLQERADIVGFGEQKA